MAADVTVDADRFGATLEQLLNGIGNEVAEKVKPCVREAAKTARSEWRSRAGREFGGTGRYASSIRYRVRESGMETHADVGSATMPGLPHLLELGHAKVGGDKVPGRKHIAPAADAAFDQFEREIDSAVDDALRSA